MNITKAQNGWEIDTTATLTDAEAAAITWKASALDVVVGDFVAVNDAEGARIGHVAKALYVRDPFGPPYALVSIDLL